MHIIRRAQFKSMPWKNGGGITHEVALAKVKGQLQWRLSLAEVAGDGPFSLFPGMARILTVIDGAGMDLRDASGAAVHAVPPLHSISFSGDDVLTGTLRDGPCLDFNLIYDPRRFAGTVRVVTGQPENGMPMVGGVLCLNGVLGCGGALLQRHDFAFAEAGETLTVEPGASALHVRLHEHAAAA